MYACLRVDAHRCTWAAHPNWNSLLGIWVISRLRPPQDGYCYTTLSSGSVTGTWDAPARAVFAASSPSPSPPVAAAGSTGFDLGSYWWAILVPLPGPGHLLAVELRCESVSFKCPPLHRSTPPAASSKHGRFARIFAICNHVLETVSNVNK